MADMEIAARACFVRIGLDPDEYPELLAEIERTLSETADGFREAGRAEVK